MSRIDDIADLRPAEVETSQEVKEQVRQEQRGRSYEDVRREMQSRNQFILEMDKLPSQTHKWTDRGMKMTCENAGHQYHEAFKILRRMAQ